MINQKIKFFIKNNFSKLRHKILGPCAKGVIYDTKNGMIAAPIEDVTVGRHLGFKGGWDLSELQQLFEYIHEESNIYVIGTHIGTLLIPISKKCKYVYGYEANPDIYWYLDMNVKMNKISNVSLFNYAIGDTARTISFYSNKVNSGGSKIKPLKENYLYSNDKPSVIDVEMVSLDDQIKEENLLAPHGIIVDIEGSEYYALKGMPNSLKNADFLYIEFVPHHLENVSGVSIEDFINLIRAHFSKVIFTKYNLSIALTEEQKLFDQLYQMQKNNLSDDLLFLN